MEAGSVRSAVVTQKLIVFTDKIQPRQQLQHHTDTNLVNLEEKKQNKLTFTGGSMLLRSTESSSQTTGGNI